MRHLILALAVLIAFPVSAQSTFSVGDRVVVDSGPLRARKAPSTSADLYGSQPSGAHGIVFQGPVDADGYEWYFVDYSTGGDGWSAASFLSSAPSLQSASAGSTEAQLAALIAQLTNILRILQERGAAGLP